jgi:hypothetical protein
VLGKATGHPAAEAAHVACQKRDSFFCQLFNVPNVYAVSHPRFCVQTVPTGLTRVATPTVKKKTVRRAASVSLLPVKLLVTERTYSFICSPWFISLLALRLVPNGGAHAWGHVPDPAWPVYPHR